MRKMGLRITFKGWKALAPAHKSRPVRPGRGVRTVAACLLVLVMGLVWWRFFYSRPEERIVTPVAIFDRIGPQMVAKARVGQYVGKTVTWSGVVTERRADSVIVNCQEGSARVELKSGQQLPREGDVVSLSASVAGRSATGLIYLKKANVEILRHGDSSRWDAVPYRFFQNASVFVNRGGEFNGRGGAKNLAESKRIFDLRKKGGHR